MFKLFSLSLLLGIMFLSSRAQVRSKKVDTIFQELTQSKPNPARIGILIQLANHYFEKGSLTNHMDSVEFYLKQARQLNEEFQIVGFQNQIDILFAKHYCLQQPGEDARNIFIPIIDVCKKTKDTLNEAQAWFELANTIGNNPDLAPFKITCFQNAMLLYGKASFGMEEMIALRNIADVHLQQRKFDLAENELFQVLKDETKAGAYNMIGSYDLLAALYITKGDYDKGLQYALKTVEMMVATGDSAFACSYYSRLTQIYLFLGKYSESIEWAKRCVNTIWATNDFTLLYRSTANVINLLLKQGKPEDALKYLFDQIAKKKPTDINDRRIVQKMLGHCYDQLKKYDLAEKHFLEMIRLGNEQGKNYWSLEKAMAYKAIGEFYFRRGNYNKVHFYLDIALENYEENGTLQSLRGIHLALFRVDSALGKYVTAINHLHQSNELNDSIFTIEKNKQIEELQISYETDKKDQLIIIKEKNIQLLTRQDELQKSKLQQGILLRNISFAVAALLIIIITLLFNRYRLKQRTNHKLELQQGEIAKQNNSLHHLVNEKEWLLKEIHHRVKNNLQIVMSLLNSQSIYIDNTAALTAIHDSQHRVHAISLIHQKLYNSENVSSIHMSFYIRELVSYLSDSFDTGQRIRFELNVEPLEMDVSQAVPLGLILNEAITNSIKYAFPGDDRNGVISVSLSNTAPDQYVLCISDNGVGIPSELNNKKSDSLGMNLMAGLSEDLDGSFSIENNNGTTVKISFVYDPGVRRPHALAPSFVSNN